jgi:hydrogenase/urease accessory protein HupE
MKIFISLLLIFFSSLLCRADKISMSYLEIQEQKVLHYTLMLKVPLREDIKLPIKVQMPQGCILSYPKTNHLSKNASILRWQIKCNEDLYSKMLLIKGLKKTDTDLLLRLSLLSGASYSSLLTPTKSSFTVPKEPSNWYIMQTYTRLGIIHILLGFDHLLFVFALLLIVKNIRRLLLTITSFTLAHSLTMAGATLGIVHIPQAPVEAMIALSILFLAMEIMYQSQKRREESLTSKYPWLISFIFGLLHGFGFAGALAEIGLPEQAITIALVFFNIGVELGQVLFVLSVILSIFLLQRLNYPKLLSRLQTVLVYIIGSLSTYWLIDRTLSF